MQVATPTSNNVLLTGDALIDGLTQGSSWWWAPGEPQVITYSLNINDDGSTPPQPDLVGGTWTQVWIDAAAAAFTAWSNVADITFQQQAIDNNEFYFQSDADIALTRTGDDLFAGSGGAIVALSIFPSPDFVTLLGIDRGAYPKPEGDIAFDNSYAGFQYLSPGGWGFHTFVHELGHALGLKHPGDDGANGRPTFTELGIEALDSPLWTVMNENPVMPAAAGFAATPMPLDILAIQHIYGANLSYHANDDVYVLADDGIVKTIWDAGGVDMIDASGLQFGIALDLRPGAFTHHGTGSTTAIAYNVTIESTIGTAFNDSITGNNADNHLDGGVGVDFISGGPGNDELIGGGGGDTLNGNNGSDTLIGANGNDTMKGGPDDDVYIVAQPGDVVIEGFNGGTDTVRSWVTFNLPANVETMIFLGASAINGVGNGLANTIKGNSADNIINGQGGNDSLVGGAGDDTLIGANGDDTLEGGPGNDVYVVAQAGDVVIEGFNAGTDTVQSWMSWALAANVENLRLLGISGLDGTGNGIANTITGNGGDNTLSSGDGDDTLIGGDGDDTLIGGNGNDSMKGGAGDDTYVVAQLGDIVIEGSGGGIDTVRSWITFGLSANVEKLVLLGAAAINGIGNDLANTISGNSGNNVLVGAAGDDTLAGGDGDDTMRGGAGDDTYIVTQAGDVVVEGFNAGTDAVRTLITYGLTSNVENVVLLGNANIHATGNWLANAMSGNGGHNALTGRNGDDALKGGAGNDTLDGSAGNDVLDGGSGADSMTGGVGNDTYIVAQAGDIVRDGFNAGDDIVQSSISYQLPRNVETLVLTGSSNINGTGNATANTITGNGGDNTLNGANGDDTLNGAAGNDSLIGSGGNDSLDGGADNDTLTGGAGDDIFVFGVGDDLDRITDFESGVDQIALSGLADFAAVQAASAEVGADLAISVTVDDVLTIQNFSFADLDMGDFLFV